MLILSIILIIFSDGCKDESELGLVLLPANDHLNTDFSDTSTIITSIKEEDTLRTDELSLQLLGSDDDPVFGVSTASVYSQVNLEGTPAFGVQPVADSLILSLAYAGYYGDTSAVQTYNVYKLSDNMFIDSTYYSDRSFAHETDIIGTFIGAPTPNSGVPVGTDTLIPQIRIKLSQAIADSIIAKNGDLTLSSNALWLNYFKGLFIEAVPVNYRGAISYFNFFNSRMTLYFHDTSTISQNYIFSLSGARVNNFTHSYGTTPVGLQLPDPTSGDSVNYLLSMAGVNTEISFPFLKHFLDSGSILINRAELKITAEPATLNFNLPTSLLLVTRNSSGVLVFPVDYYESAEYFGGTLNTSTNEYTFNIARHLQRYLDGTVPNADFSILISGSGVEATRAVIKSGKNLNAKMKLSLFYTKLY